MASFTLFDKPLYTGIGAAGGSEKTGRGDGAEQPDTDARKGSGGRGKRAAPVHGVRWQVLTAGGLRLSCTTPGALLSWPHDKNPLLGVSLDGHGWRRADQFHGLVRRGVALEQAFYDSDWLE